MAFQVCTLGSTCIPCPHLCMHTGQTFRPNQFAALKQACTPDCFPIIRSTSATLFCRSVQTTECYLASGYRPLGMRRSTAFTVCSVAFCMYAPLTAFSRKPRGSGPLTIVKQTVPSVSLLSHCCFGFDLAHTSSDSAFDLPSQSYRKVR